MKFKEYKLMAMTVLSVVRDVDLDEVVDEAHEMAEKAEEMGLIRSQQEKESSIEITTLPEENPIGYLQEVCQKSHNRLPKYVSTRKDSVGIGFYESKLTLKWPTGDIEVIGKGPSKKVARFNAAEKGIEALKEADPDYLDML